MGFQGLALRVFRVYREREMDQGFGFRGWGCRGLGLWDLRNWGLWIKGDRDWGTRV